MFSSTMNRIHRFSVIVCTAVLILALTAVYTTRRPASGPLSPPELLASSAAAAEGKPVPPAAPAEPSTQASSSSVQTGQQVVLERLSKIKSAQELMERNKSFPMLHQDFSDFQSSVEVMATGYYAGVESTGKQPGHPEYGITKSGVKVKQGILSTIAADPKVFPLGTILYIPGYGYGIVADTGSAIKGKKIDLYYKSKAQIYKEWGKKKVNVFVVHTGNGKVSEETLREWNDIMTAVSAKQQLPYPL